MEEKKIDRLEIARIIGEPKDPRKPYPEIVSLVCETDTAEPNEYTYQFDVLDETDKVYIITSSGILTQENVSPDTPGLMTFIDISTPEYWVKITDLADAKERTLARKKDTINRSLNAWETQKVLQVIDAAVPSGNKFTLSSGNTRFTYQDLVYMINSIADYSDNYVLIAGTTIDQDIKLWDWNDNKYTSLALALQSLNVKIIRQFGSVTVDSTPASILAATTAYLIGLQGVSGKPVLFVRKKLSSIDFLGAALFENGDQPERLVFAGMNPVNVTSGTERALAISVNGYEKIAIAVTNPKCLARFLRS